MVDVVCLLACLEELPVIGCTTWSVFEHFLCLVHKSLAGHPLRDCQLLSKNIEKMMNSTYHITYRPTCYYLEMISEKGCLYWPFCFSSPTRSTPRNKESSSPCFSWIAILGWSKIYVVSGQPTRSKRVDRPQARESRLPQEAVSHSLRQLSFPFRLSTLQPACLRCGKNCNFPPQATLKNFASMNRYN